jgi:hypothetical protein
MRRLIYLQLRADQPVLSPPWAAPSRRRSALAADNPVTWRDSALARLIPDRILRSGGFRVRPAGH